MWFSTHRQGGEACGHVSAGADCARVTWGSRGDGQQVPGPNATVMDIKGFPMHDVSAVEGALKAARFCVVARKAGNAGATALYMSCKTGEARLSMFLLHASVVRAHAQLSTLLARVC